MTPRLFQAGSMRDALLVVREAFGDSAVIVDTRIAAEGVEVWAASDEGAVGAPLPQPLAATPRGVVLPEAPAPKRAAVVVPLGGSLARRRLRHPVLEGHPTTFLHGRYAFVGPCGAGKTSLVAKFAANHVLRYGPDEMGVVTLDRWRPGGVDELARLTRLLHVPLGVCATASELAMQLERFADRSCVLIDTPGVPLDSDHVQERLAALAELGDAVSCIVTVPLTLRGSAVRKLLDALGAEHLDAAALTHGDDVNEVGEVLDELDAQLLPAYWLSTGPDIPDDVESADGEAMRRLLAGGSQDAAADEAG